MTRRGRSPRWPSRSRTFDDDVQQPALTRPACSLEAAADVELAVDVREVELHRLVGDPEDLGDLAVRPAPGDELQDLELATGQLAQELVVRRRDGPLLRTRQVERRLERLPDRCRDRFRVRRLQHVCGRAAVERGVDHTAVVGTRENDHRQLRRSLAAARDDSERCLEPFRQVDLHDEQIRLMLVQERVCCPRRRGRADEVDVETSEQRRQCRVTQRMRVKRYCLPSWSVEFVLHRFLHTVFQDNSLYTRLAAGPCSSVAGGERVAGGGYPGRAGGGAAMTPCGSVLGK